MNEINEINKINELEPNSNKKQSLPVTPSNGAQSSPLLGTTKLQLSITDQIEVIHVDNGKNNDK